MINPHVLNGSDWTGDLQERCFHLRNDIAAIQLLDSENAEEAKLGMITQLPAGAVLHVCGPGFNERTLKVRWAEGMYFVFLQDVEDPLSFQASG
jgi:hypothetical protein